MPSSPSAARGSKGGRTTPLYYTTKQWLEEDDVIQPGNWVKTVLGLGQPHNFYYRELLFEAVRRAEYADRPSRGAVVFTFPTLDVALSLWRGSEEHVYEVAAADQVTASDHDMRWFDSVAKPNSFGAALDFVRPYWSGALTTSPLPETLVPSAMRVVRRVRP